jgi:hypothetical protein
MVEEGADRPPIADSGEIRLVDFGSEQYLIHTLTGESVGVFGTPSCLVGGPWKLSFAGEEAVLVGSGSEEEFCVSTFGSPTTFLVNRSREYQLQVVMHLQHHQIQYWHQAYMSNICCTTLCLKYALLCVLQGIVFVCVRIEGQWVVSSLGLCSQVQLYIVLIIVCLRLRMYLYVV